MKFGTEVVLKGGKVLGGGGGGVTRYPDPPGMGCINGIWGASGASSVRFGKHFIKQTLLGTPDLVGVGHLFGPQIRIQKDLGPMVTHYEGEFIKSKLHHMFLLAIW